MTVVSGEDQRVYADPSVAVPETHAAVVFLVGDRAHKLKKPVGLGFLDFSTLERRPEVCRQEVALNCRLAPFPHGRRRHNSGGARCASA